MLQQTQVQTVLSRYYFPFLKRFPTLQALAEAPLQEVLKVWEGLGYYSRARNLHRAAQMTAPALPVTVDELMRLPGIGRNTAHAIAAFAYHQPVAVMEANVKRVLHRLLARLEMNEKELWEAASALVDPENPYIYNQAVMDIGATICTPAAPACAICPLNESCEGKYDPLAYPAKRVKKPVPVRRKRIMVFEQNGMFYVTPRESRLLGGLYGFPEYEMMEEVIFEGISYREPLQLIGNAMHVYSHFKLSADVYLVPYQGKGEQGAENHWYDREALKQLPLSKIDHKVMGLLEDRAL